MRIITRWIPAVILFVLFLAIWKANGGDLTKMTDSVWALLNKGADIVLSLWAKFTSVTASSTPAS